MSINPWVERPRHEQLAECRKILRHMERTGELLSASQVQGEVEIPATGEAGSRFAPRQRPRPEPIPIRILADEAVDACKHLANGHTPTATGSYLSMSTPAVKEIGRVYAYHVQAIAGAVARGASTAEAMSRLRCAVLRDAEGGWVTVTIPEPEVVGG